MPRHVRLTTLARRQLREALGWYTEQGGRAIGEKWLRGIQARIDSLAENPERHGLAHETDEFPFELRQMLYGSGRRISHRVLFHIADDEVTVVAILHVAQRDLSPDDL